MVRKFLNEIHHFPYDSLRLPENEVPVAFQILKVLVPLIMLFEGKKKLR